MTVLTDDERRAEVLRLASGGVPPLLLHRLCGEMKGARREPLKRFLRRHKTDIEAGQALADARVMQALHELAVSGKSVQATLAWAKQRLGWHEEGEETGDRTSDSSEKALALLKALLEDVASSKAGGAYGAPQLAAVGASEPVAAAGR